MPKMEITYVCQNCGYRNPRWFGRCPSCNEFNTLKEEVEETVGMALDQTRSSFNKESPIPITQVKPTREARMLLGFPEVDRVFSGGIVFGSVALIAGEPGIGKSTLVLQMLQKIAETGHRVLYVSAEESIAQTKIRADRLGIQSPNLLIVSEINVNIIKKYIDEIKPTACVIDSIQMIYKPEIPSAPGMISQVRECTIELIYLAKRLGLSLFIIGHVTKEGAIAGPKIIEHLVDGVFYFEGDRFQSFRILRSTKNRFGSTQEIGIFEMKEKGLAGVSNPSELFMSSREENLIGSCVVPSVIGSRVLLVEIQALTSRSGFGVPARRVSGIDFNRAIMILAILERRGGLHLGLEDVFVSAVGGVKIDEPAADLGIAITIASSFKNKVIDAKTVAFGELGLTGEVRGVNQVDGRLAEAKRLGFERAIISHYNLRGARTHGLEIADVKNIREALDILNIT